MRVISIAFLVVLAVLICSLPTSSQTSTTAQGDPQAVATLQKAFTAMGGQVVGIPTSQLFSGTETRYSNDASTTSYSIQVEVLGADKFRWITNGPEGSVTTIIAGATGQTQSVSGAQTVPAYAVFGNTIANVPLLALSRWIGIASLQVQSLGQEVIGGQSLNHLVISGLTGGGIRSHETAQSQDDRCELYVDPATSLPMRLRFYQRVQNAFVPHYLSSFVPIDVAFSDYRTVNGVTLPFTLTRYLNDQKISVIQIRSIQLNVALNSQDFAFD